MAEIHQNSIELEKILAAKEAVLLVKENDLVGLGTGSTASYAIQELAQKIKEGLSNIRGVASSKKTEALAESLGIPLLPIGEVNHIDISIDGADEFTEECNLIKGGGGALFREKIVASLSENRIVIADRSKKVEKLGAFKVPVEIVPVAYQYVLGQIKKLNGVGSLRKTAGEIFVTDNQNFIVDVDFGLIDDVQKLSYCLNNIDGLLAHGLFVDLTSKIIMAKDNQLHFYINVK